MSMQAALRAHLLADVAMATLVGPRVDWDIRPQSDALEAVTLQRISDPDDDSFAGPQALRRPRVQADIWSASRIGAIAIEGAVVAALPIRTVVGDTRFDAIFVDDRRDTIERSDAGATIFRTSIDLFVWHQPA